MCQYFILFYGCIILHCIFLSPFICWWAFGLFPPFDYWQQSCYEHLCTSFCFQFLWVYRSVIAGWYGISMFNVLSNHQTVFQHGWTILHSYQQCMRIPISPHPHQHFLIFFILAILLSVKCYLTVVWVCSFLTTNDVEHLFMCLLATCISSLEKYLFKSFVHFLMSCLSFCCWVVRARYIFWILALYRIYEL